MNQSDNSFKFSDQLNESCSKSTANIKNNLWSGKAFKDAFEGKKFNILSTKYIWMVRNTSEIDEETLFDLLRKVYSGVDSIKDDCISKLREHQLIVIALSDKNKVSGFIPLKRYEFGWKTSFIGHINSFRTSIGVNHFLSILEKNRDYIPYAVQVSGKIGNYLIRHSKLPIIPFKDVKKIKGNRVYNLDSIDNVSLLKKTLKNGFISKDKKIRKDAYLTDINWLKSTELEWKVMMGKVIIADPKKYYLKKLEDFIDDKEWTRRCNRLKQILRKGYSHLGYHGSDILSIYDHTERVIQASLKFALGSQLCIEDIYSMAGLHDFIESVTGDIMSDTISLEKKFEYEKKSWEKTVMDDVGDEAWPLYQLWLKYESQSSEESILVWNIDKMEPLIEAIEFFNRHTLLRPVKSFILPSIIKSVESKVTHPELKKIIQKLKNKEVQKIFNINQYYEWLKKAEY